MESEVPTSSPLLRISTKMLSERDFFSAFREGFARPILMLDVIDHSSGRPYIEVSFMPLGPVAVGTASSNAVEWVRHKHHVKDCRDDFRLDIVANGPLHFEHAGKEGVYKTGTALFVSHAQPHRGFGPHEGSVRNVTVEAATLRSLVANPEDRVGYPVHPGPALRLLDGYLRSLTSLEEPPPPELATVIGVHLLDLVAAALGPTREAKEIVAKRGVKAARLRAILAEIAKRFSDPGFDLDNVAAALGLSRRYVQQILEETGKSFTEHLVEHRLERAFSMLSRYLHLAIIDIAFTVGFGDVSHFNRVFRRRFGETPSGVRAGASATEPKG
jgi:AraC-like DNA-binding protein